MKYYYGEVTIGHPVWRPEIYSSMYVYYNSSGDTSCALSSDLKAGVGNQRPTVPKRNSIYPSGLRWSYKIIQVGYLRTDVEPLNIPSPHSLAHKRFQTAFHAI